MIDSVHSFEYGFLFPFFNTVTENWLTVATGLHSVKHGRQPAVPFTTLWFPAHVGYTGKHKDTCKLSHIYKNDTLQGNFAS